MTKYFRIYGRNGHRQAASFGESCSSTTWSGEKTVTVLCSDITGTNDYVDVIIGAEAEQICYSGLQGQLTDGIFENCRYGEIHEIVNGEEFKIVWRTIIENNEMHEQIELIKVNG